MPTSPKRVGLFGAALALLFLVMLPSSAPATAVEPGMDHPIVQAGLKYLGGHGGQCYMFARTAVLDATGKRIGSAYRQGYFAAGAIEIDPSDAQAGDILQISNPSDQGRYYAGMHTAIVIENYGNGSYKVIDSNWGWDERVRIHDWTPRPASHLRLYAYRISAGPPPDLPAAPSLAVGVETTVSTGDGSCLNLRSAPGIGNSIISCLPDGSPVTVISEPVSVGGYTWVKVATSRGEGWVASEYLRAVSAPSGADEPAAAAAPVESAPAPIPALAVPPGTVFAVTTDGSCLNTRDGAGFGFPIRRCLVDGVLVTAVTGVLVEAEGYVWLEVDSPAGRGWAAATYLARR
jgi:uncharacterized protein YraI